jgi:prenyltransferase beta subunit
VLLILSLPSANAANVEKALSWLGSRQQSNGGFGYTTNTAFASLALALSPEHVNASIMAAEYLKSVQNSDGGWGDVISTASALRALSYYNISAEGWIYTHLELALLGATSL